MPPESSPPREIRVVCGLIESPDGRVLAARRATGHLAGKWEFPGGKIEPGETPGAAIERELREELGCRVAAGALLTTVRHVYPDVSLVIHLTPVICRLLAGEPEAREHLEIRWVAPADLRALDWAAADVPVAEEWLAKHE